MGLGVPPHGVRWNRSVKFQGQTLRGTNFALGWDTQNFARRFDAENAYCANDFAGCGRPAEAMRTGVERTMECLRLLVDAHKTHCLRLPEEPLEFLVYSVGSNYPQITDASRDRPQDLSQDRRVDASAYGYLDAGTTTPERLNRAVLSCTLLLLGIGQAGVQGDRRERDETVESCSCAGSTGSAGERTRPLGSAPEARNG